MLHPVPLAYRIFLQWLEPIGAIGGTIQAHFMAKEFIALQLAPATAFTVTPELQMVLTQEASLYAYFAIIEALVLRQTRDMKVWNSILFAILVADLGHLYGLYVIRGGDYSFFWSVWLWTTADWMVWGVTVISFLVRVAYFLGLGFSSHGKKVKSR